MDLDTTRVLGNVFESQQNRENHLIWNEGLPTQDGWDCLYKRFTTVVSVQEGSHKAKNNAGLLFNYTNQSNFWVAVLDLDEKKTFCVRRKRAGQWELHDEVEVTTLTPGNSYKIEVEVLPLDTASSTYGFVTVRLTGLDDNISQELSGITLPDFMPGTGYVGFYSNRSESWFEDLLVEHYSP